ncbi:hypothetical protein M406DRAFT_59717 [Cryphonectria parasitica EP155]|uniref:LPXTG-domain-containing protein n=1 Tax=Cryphonectria parasitica (strain ATCC 38755 / EP155) TaxID=660469 RepID=A0A9P4YD35_CRYP1|nr:uncharacterized protein M406DRAFT_59717 [Cryphonectria parasitica EP155]KAF3770873.1 hypothetical protein M406DRAFT_59717 [Cryphonectria parasitica EP155]
MFAGMSGTIRKAWAVPVIGSCATSYCFLWPPPFPGIHSVSVLIVLSLSFLRVVEKSGQTCVIFHFPFGFYIPPSITLTPNSPCFSKCLGSSDTVSADIACEDAEITSTTTGSTWKECMSCLQNSTYSQGGESDQAWFLYNLRYSFDSCVFAYPNDTSSGSNPCETSTSCGALKTALEYDQLNATDAQSNEFGYCDADGGALTGQYFQPCMDCVSDSGDTNYIANALVALNAGCTQKPNATDPLGLSASVFSSSVIQAVDPSTVNKSTSGFSLSTAAIGGIVAGGVAVLILVAVVIFFRCRKRKNGISSRRTPRWARDKRRSSFSFKCLVDRPVTEGRYFIETKPRLERHPYETAIDGWKAQDAKLAPPPAAHPSPKENTFDISPSSTQHSTRYYSPAEHSSSPSQESSRGHQQQHGWPSAREIQEPWFPPPPPPGPPPSTTKFGRKVSPGTVRKGKRESGSPVESKQIQTWFPGPPQR